jgi:oligopeptide/dipeptide ABC transporter ATP-binding protein
VLSVRDVSCRLRAGGLLVRDVSFDLAKGETLGLVGESGSGKSMCCLTALRLLPAAVEMAAGSVVYMDTDLTTLTSRELRDIRGCEIAYVPQHSLNSLNPVATVRRHVAASLTAHQFPRKEIPARTGEILRLVGFREPDRISKLYPHQLSGGMRQRVVLACALALHPKVLVADEPTTALDPTIQLQILDLLSTLQAELGLSVLIVTHDFGVVKRICDQVVVLYAGQVVEQGTCSQVIDKAMHPYTAGLIRSVPKESHPRGEHLPTIPGRPANSAMAGPGCPFAPRCEFAMDRCRHVQPPTITVEPAHSAACWLLDAGSHE